MNKSGGNTPIYLANKLIRLDDCSKLKPTEGFGIDGSQVDITIIKSRNGKSGSVASCIVDKNIGFDKELSLFLLLKQHGKVGGAGAYLTIGDCPIKFSQKQFKTKLAENPELRQTFMQEVQKVLHSIIESNYQEFMTMENDYNDISSDIMNIMNDAA